MVAGVMVLHATAFLAAGRAGMMPGVIRHPVAKAGAAEKANALSIAIANFHAMDFLLCCSSHGRRTGLV